MTPRSSRIRVATARERTRSFAALLRGGDWADGRYHPVMGSIARVEGSLDFLGLIVRRYEREATPYITQSSRRLQDLSRGKAPSAAALERDLSRVDLLALQVDIESFFLFGRVLLDRVALMAGALFEIPRLDRHTALISELKSGGLLFGEFASSIHELANELGLGLGIVRNSVVHTTDPTTTPGFVLRDGKLRVFYSPNLPAEPVEGEDIAGVESLINGYVLAVVDASEARADHIPGWSPREALPR